MKIILASSSVYRRALMDQLNVPYEHVAPDVDENHLKKMAPVSTNDLPQYLAQKKAESLVKAHPKAIIIGCDQMAVLKNKGLDKPGSPEKAVTQLLRLQGQTHQIITGLAVYCKNQWELSSTTAQLKMKPLTETQIKRYVDLEKPIDCAGSYKIEKMGIVLFESIKTEDPSAIVGMPLMALARILEKFGVPLP